MISVLRPMSSKLKMSNIILTSLKNLTQLTISITLSAVLINLSYLQLKLVCVNRDLVVSVLSQISLSGLKREKNLLINR